MEQTAKLVRVRVRQRSSGMLFASSEDEPSLFIAVNSADQMNLAIPAVLEDLYRAKNQKVAVVATSEGQCNDRRWAIIPHDLLTELANRQPNYFPYAPVA